MIIDSLDQLRALYPAPQERSLKKQLGALDAHCLRFIALSPFVVIASSGDANALDASPRGGAPGFVRALDAHTLLIPDAPGNNRLDTLENIVATGRVGLLFLIPGSGSTLRVNGRARLSTDPALLDSFVMEGKAPRSVTVIAVDSVYFQCARAIIRSDLWNPAKHVAAKDLPTPGQILASITDARVGGEEYDRVWPLKAKETMW